MLSRIALTSATGVHQHRKAAEATLSEFVQRLGKLLGWDESQQARWLFALTPLLSPAGSGTWPPAAKVLYELQAMVLDLEKDLYRVDPPGWIRRFFRGGILSKLDLARDVIKLMHLKRALRSVGLTPLTDGERKALEVSLQELIEATEEHLRHRITPILQSVLR